MNALETIRVLEKEMQLSPLERILSVSDGSVTRILEAWIGEPMNIRTISQVIKSAGNLGAALGVDESEEVNFREVEICDCLGSVLIRAKSWTPLSRLEPGFREDLMKADVPIGKLLEKHNIEARREIRGAEIKSGKVNRTYDIIRGGKLLMRISESLIRCGP
jgi:beta-ribofuranosylaminobenzene 5'-phosphate synthase